MKKYVLLTTLVLLMVSGNKAQTLDYIYKNEFTENYMNDDDSRGFDRNSYMQGGFYYFEQMVDNGFWFFVEKFNVDPSKDYEIEIKMQPYGYISDASCFGMIFSGRHDRFSERFNTFVMNPKGRVNVGTNKDGVETDVMKWEKKPEVLAADEWYVFKIKNQAGQQHFYINNKKVYQCKHMEIHDRWYGFYIDGVMGIKVDYFTIKQSRDAITENAYFKKLTKQRVSGIFNDPDKDDICPTLSKDGKELYSAKVAFQTGYFVMNNGIPFLCKSSVDTAGNIGYAKRIKTLYYSPWYIATTPEKSGFYVGQTSSYPTSYQNSMEFVDPETGVFDLTKKMNLNADGIVVKHVSISKDGSVMVFSGYKKYEPAGLELYVCKKSGGSWGSPALITTLNTHGDEMTPFISGDMKKLFFSSDGHPGYGYSDVFVAERQDDSWLNWSSPENLGKGINDGGCNLHFTLPDTGNFAYLSSNYGHIHNLDVYKVRLPKKKIEPLVLKGKIIYEKGTDGTLKNLNLVYDKKTLKKENLTIDPVTGTFSTELKRNEPYKIQLPDSNFIIISQKEVASNLNPNEKSLEIIIKKLKKGESFVLENIYFSPNKTELLPASYPSLDMLLNAMISNPDLKIEVQGHTSKTTEGEVFNKELSTNRAAAVRDYLIGKGINAARIKSEGYGYTRPLYTDTTEEHQAKNRRVEIKIL